MEVTIFKNAKLKGKNELVDILVEDGIYKEIGKGISEKYKDVKHYDLNGN